MLKHVEIFSHHDQPRHYTTLRDSLSLTDPLSATICAYYTGVDLLNSSHLGGYPSEPDRDAGEDFGKITMTPALDALEEWRWPAQSAHSAIAALSLVLNDYFAEEVIGDKAAVAMIKAALAYLKSSVEQEGKADA